MLTTAGGALIAKGWLDEGMLGDLIGWLVAGVGLAWSIWEKKRKATASAAPNLSLLAGLFLGLASFALFTGCASISKDGPYKGDEVLYNADRAITSSYDVLHAFVKWEYQNRESLGQWPEIREAADVVRANAERWIDSAIVLRDIYAADPSPENRLSLENSLATLRAALNEASKYLQSKPATSNR